MGVRVGLVGQSEGGGGQSRHVRGCEDKAEQGDRVCHLALHKHHSGRMLGRFEQPSMLV